jgi:hypothetical protein
MLGKCLRDRRDVKQAFVTFQGLRKARVERRIQAARRKGSRKIPKPVMGLVRALLLPQFLKAGVRGAQQT